MTDATAAAVSAGRDARRGPSLQAVMEAVSAIVAATTPQALLQEVTQSAVALTDAPFAIGRVTPGPTWTAGIEARIGEDHAAPGRPALVIPLVGREERTAGSIEVGYPESHGFAPDDTQLLVQLATFAGTALENMRLYHAMAEAEAQREAFFGILSHELRTPHTCHHTDTHTGWGALAPSHGAPP